jgi:hypothetical protein
MRGLVMQGFLGVFHQVHQHLAQQGGIARHRGQFWRQIEVDGNAALCTNASLPRVRAFRSTRSMRGEGRRAYWAKASTRPFMAVT